MPTDIVMPQMGESIFEGTITKWLKKPGEKIQRDEPLFEISTDKVDAEIPAPASGVLKEIKAEEGTTVQVNTVVGVIDEAGGAAAATSPKPSAKAAEPAKVAGATKTGATATDGAAPKPAAKAPAPPAAVPQAEGTSRAEQPQATEAAADDEQEFPAGDGERVRTSPLVRKLAREHNVDLAAVRGTGLGGRVTKDDIA